MTTPQEAADILLRSQRDPVGWWREVLGFNPWPTQAAIVESVRDNRRTAVRSCHSIGKSRTAAATAIWFLETHPRALVLTTAPTHRQVEGILWREIHEMVRNAKRPLGGKIHGTKLSVDDDWWAWGFTAPDYDATRFQGFHAPHILVIVDESAGVTSTIMEGLESAMSAGHARRLDIGNPTDPDCEFARMFSREDVKRFAVDAFETPNFTACGVTIDDVRTNVQIDGKNIGAWRDKVDAYLAVHGALPYPTLIQPEWVAEKWMEWCRGDVGGESDPRWMGRVRAQFPTSAEDALLPSDWINAAMERHTLVDWSAARGSPCRIGADVARFGGDSTRIATHFPGFGVRSVDEVPPLPIDETARAIVERVLIEDSLGHIVDEVRIDADGLGAGVYDCAMKLVGERAVEIRNGASAQDKTRFANARSEMLWHLRESIDPRGEVPIALPVDEELRVELRHFRWRLRPDGRIIVESKDDMKKRIGRSPDRADSVAYAVCRLDVLTEGLIFV